MKAEEEAQFGGARWWHRHNISKQVLTRPHLRSPPDTLASLHSPPISPEPFHPALPVPLSHPYQLEADLVQMEGQTRAGLEDILYGCGPGEHKLYMGVDGSRRLESLSRFVSTVDIGKQARRTKWAKHNRLDPALCVQPLALLHCFPLDTTPECKPPAVNRRPGPYRTGGYPWYGRG